MVPAPHAAPAVPAVPGPEEVVFIPMPAAGAGRVFTAADPGITPPVLVRPNMPIPLDQGDKAAGLSVVEVIVSETGEVQMARLVSPARDYREAMMLSAIKTWRFEPAAVDGLPVRYRLRVRFDTSAPGAIR